MSGPRLAARYAALLATVVLVAGGCGGGDSSSQKAQEEASAATSASHFEGGEKSIENYGGEATGSDRAALLGVFHGYLGALAAKDYAGACSHLSSLVRHSLKQLAGKAGRALSCPAILPRLLAPTAATISREQVDGRVTKVRTMGNRAFVVFHAPGAKLYQLTMTREGETWHAATVAAAVLVPSAATLGR